MMNNEPHGFHDQDTDVMGNKGSNWTGLWLYLIIMYHDDIMLGSIVIRVCPVRSLQHAYVNNTGPHEINI